MAKLGGVVSGFVPVELPKAKSKPKLIPKNKHNGILHCANCGHEEQYSVYRARKWLQGDGEQYCQGCTTFFGLVDASSFMDHNLPGGFTTDSFEEAKDKIKRVKETKFILIKNTQSFGGAKTGISIEIEFGDIFSTIRSGSDNQTELGTTKAAFDASTVDVQLGPEILTLYTHEIIPINWLDVMQLRKEGIIEEQFLSKDCQGYFAPTESGKKLLTEMFGRR